MFAIVGILLVFGAVIGGFLMEKGHLAVLVQPAEFLIIVGAGPGTLLIANPMHILKAIFAGAMGVFGKSHYGKERYLSSLKMMFELLNKIRRAGMLSIEMDIEKPEESVIFNAYPEFIHDHHVRSFVCDTTRTAVTGGVEPFDMDQMMDLDMEVQHRCANQPISALTTVADSLPGLGIVAAVLGVVITMGALGGPPEAIGHKVAAALVGTFLGILLCYGLVGPIGSYMGKKAEEEHAFLYVLRVLMNTSDHVRKVIAGYFNDPRGRASLTGTDRAGSDDKQPLTKENVQQLKESLEKAILQTDHFRSLSNQIEIRITPEGLRIELLESKNGTFFDTGGTVLNAKGRELLTMLAQQLSSVPNSISIEGHTDSLPYVNDAGYGNRELSADRANAARRLMQEKGLRADQVSQVRGYADQRLRLPKSPLDPSNRRISLIVQNLDAPATPSSSGDPAKHPVPAVLNTTTQPAATVPVKPVAAPGNSAAGVLARLHSH